MRKIIAVVILIGLGALLWINPGIYNTKNQDKTEQLYDSRIEEDEILQLVKANAGILNLRITELQTSPEEIVNFNSMVMKLMYSVEPNSKKGKSIQLLTREELELLADIQREYYHEDLLAENDKMTHIQGVVQEVEKAIAAEEYIVDYKINSTTYDSNNPDVATVFVTFIPNYSDGREALDIRMNYLLERENIEGNKLWFIKGWVGAPDALVTK